MQLWITAKTLEEGKAWGCLVAGENVVCAPMKKVVCMYICDPVENPMRKASYELSGRI
jgi:hypothetical protein